MRRRSSSDADQFHLSPINIIKKKTRSDDHWRFSPRRQSVNPRGEARWPRHSILPGKEERRKKNPAQCHVAEFRVLAVDREARRRLLPWFSECTLCRNPPLAKPLVLRQCLKRTHNNETVKGLCATAKARRSIVRLLNRDVLAKRAWTRERNNFLSPFRSGNFWKMILSQDDSKS